MNKKVLSIPYVIFIIGGTIIPLIMMCYYGLTTDEGAFTFANIAAIAEAGHLKALFTALLYALISTVICFLIAFPLAVILRRMNAGKMTIIFIFL